MDQQSAGMWADLDSIEQGEATRHRLEMDASTVCNEHLENVEGHFGLDPADAYMALSAAQVAQRLTQALGSPTTGWGRGDAAFFVSQSPLCRTS
jgi:hypothetical protein